MNRNIFFKALLAVGTFFSTPFTVRAKGNSSRVGKGLKVDAGMDRYGKPISLFEGDTFYTKVSTTDSDGDLYVFESTRTKEGGPSFHLHYDQDEFWYIMKGEFFFKIGDDTFTAKEGDTVFGPRKVPHAFSKVGDGEAKILMFFQPAGKMEEMFRKISEGLVTNMTEEEQDKFRNEHGIQRVGPPIKYFKKW
jgi:mannose-6-phosphate isomerase-like protein (cupin superfamily)